MKYEKFLEDIQKFATESLLDIVIGIVVLIIGLVVIGWIVKIIRKLLEPAKIDKTLKPFIVSLTNISLKIMLVIAVYELIGGKATSFIAVLGAASLAIGLAFQGALSNFAGGVLILSLRPFHVGDYVEVDGHQGIVEAIHVFNTILVTLDNKVVSIPNGSLANTSVINYTEKPERRVDLMFGVGYESDLKLVVSLLEKVAADHPLVMKDPAPFIRLAEHADSSLNFTVRLWCKTDDYWTVYFDVIDQVKTIFDENNISIPFPQMDVHLDK